MIGKGIGYIQFETKDEMRKAIDDLNDEVFKGRELRVKKASRPERLKKKERKRQEIRD